MSKKRLKMKIKDRSVSEQKLIEAAEDAFSKHGFDKATTRDIAEKAGVNLALIARYFEGKHGLLMAVLERKIVEVRTIDLGPIKENFMEECVAYATARFNHITQNVDFFRIVIAQFLTDDKFLRRFQEVVPLEFECLEFEERMSEFIKNKKISAKCNPKEFIDTIERNVVSIVLFEMIMQKVPKDRALEMLKRFVTSYVPCTAK